MKALTDASIMWFGIHKGKALESVPNEYLLFLYENNKCPKNLRDYIRENLDSISPNRKNK